MKHIMALLVKIVMITLVCVVFFNLFNDYPFGRTFALVLLLVGISYLAGDLGILPMTNNSFATLSDVALSTLTIWLIGPFILDAPVTFTLAFITSLVLAAGEWFFHKYMVRSVLPRKEAI